MTLDEVSKHTFNRAVDASLLECTSISNQRGGEYADSWATENQSTHFLDLALREIYDTESVLGLGMSKEAKRLLMLASLCDVKVSRMGGPYKRDTFIDMINYVAAFNTLLGEYRDNNWSAN